MWQPAGWPQYYHFTFCHASIGPLPGPPLEGEGDCLPDYEAGPLPGYNRTSPRPSPWRGGSSFCLMMKQDLSPVMTGPLPGPPLEGEGDCLPDYEAGPLPIFARHGQDLSPALPLEGRETVCQVMTQDLSPSLPGMDRTSPRPSPWRGGSSFCQIMKQDLSTVMTGPLPGPPLVGANMASG